MRILNLCGYSWEIGGPSKVIYDHTRVQLSLGAQVTILTPLSPGERLYPVPDGAEAITVPRHRLARFVPEFSPELLRFYRQNAHRFDLVHIHGPFHFAGWVPFMAQTQAKKVFTVHGTLDRWAMRKSAWKKQLIGSLFQKNFVDKCELVQVHNPDEAEDLVRFLGHSHPNTVMINNGMDLTDYERLPARNAFRSRIGVSENTPLILFLSRINVKKGLNLLLPAFEEILKTLPEARLAIVGPDDGYLNWVQQYVTGHGLADKVFLPGMLTGTQKLEALVDADVFALPTYSESFSLAALEAMICGTPVLTSSRVGFGHLLAADPAACVVDTTVTAVTAGLLRLLTDRAEAARLHRAGPAFVHRYADINVVATRLYREFEKIVHG